MARWDHICSFILYTLIHFIHSLFVHLCIYTFRNRVVLSLRSGRKMDTEEACKNSTFWVRNLVLLHSDLWYASSFSVVQGKWTFCLSISIYLSIYKRLILNQIETTEFQHCRQCVVTTTVGSVVNDILMTVLKLLSFRLSWLQTLCAVDRLEISTELCYLCDARVALKRWNSGHHRCLSLEA